MSESNAIINKALLDRYDNFFLNWTESGTCAKNWQNSQVLNISGHNQKENLQAAQMVII